LIGSTVVRSCSRTVTIGATITTTWTCGPDHSLRTTDDGSGPERFCVPNPAGDEE